MVTERIDKTRTRPFSHRRAIVTTIAGALLARIARHAHAQRDPAALETFVALSRILTGRDELDAQLVSCPVNSSA